MIIECWRFRCLFRWIHRRRECRRRVEWVIWDWGSFVGPFLGGFSIFIRFFAFISWLVLGLEGRRKVCSDLSFKAIFRTLPGRFTSRLILKRLRIIEELYANEFQPNDKLLEPKAGKCKICKSSRYSKSSHSQRNTLPDQQLVNEVQKCI